MSCPETPCPGNPIDKLDGREYPVAGEVFVVSVGRYRTPDRPVAVQIFRDGAPECKLTVNLDGQMDRLGANEIFVKATELEWTLPHLEALGFAKTNRFSMYGNWCVAHIWEYHADREVKEPQLT